MSKKLIISLVLLTVAPLAMVSWLGVSRLRDQQKLLERQFQVLVENQLTVISQDIGKVLSTIQDYLVEKLEGTNASVTAMQGLAGGEPLARQVFHADAEGVLEFPDSSAELSSEERAFLHRTALIWQSKTLLAPPPRMEGKHITTRNKRGVLRQRSYKSAQVQAEPRHFWTPWYWEEGLHLLLWKKQRDGSILGMEVERIALVSKIVAAMPEGAEEKGCYTIFDGQNRPVYQWGEYERSEDEKALARSSLLHPLNTWSIRYFGPEKELGASVARTQTFNLALIIAFLVLIIIGTAVFFYRESSRDLREAEQRVNFVSRVSHELKTPLTNIRLYTELMADKIDEENEDAREQLSIIASESQRLSRLINNILTFSKKKKSGLKLHKSEGVIDTVVENTVEQYRLSLDKCGIKEIDLDLKAGNPMSFDRDALSQIIANLISNVEKYAAEGGYVSIKTEQKDTQASITVCDMGPGIPEDQREKVFAPYHRLNQSLTEGVSGTGIGLAIARDLARMHGGDLVLVESDKGSCFKLTLPVAG
jgi:signal transduction histidine kinase